MPKLISIIPMNLSTRLLPLLFIVFFLAACSPQPATDLASTAFIPKPATVVPDLGAFKLSSSTVVYYNTNELEAEATYLAGKLGEVSGMDISIQPEETLMS